MMLAVQDIARLVALEQGAIDNAVMYDEGIYEREFESIFRHTWLFVGHESSIPNPGDYITNFMGPDQVIVTRDRQGKLRVLLNKCLHRGNKVCLFDRGNTKNFVCTFHGWQYGTDGTLTAVPHLQDAYLGALDRDQWGLQQVPRLETYGGLIFASWDVDIMPLDPYLGDAKWYLDRLTVVDFLGGLEVLGGRQRYMMPTNWKAMAENFQGDDFHVGITHASYFRVLSENLESIHAARIGHDLEDTGVQAALGYPNRVPHGFGAMAIGTDDIGPGNRKYEWDLMIAQRIGDAEMVDWVKERYRLTAEFEKNDAVKVYDFANANIFPNFSMISTASTFQARGLIQWHPKAPLLTEEWQWFAVERNAPRSVKELAMRNLMFDQAAAGMIATDDSENFERSTDNMQGSMSKEKPFHFAMALGTDSIPDFMQSLRARGIDTASIPGLLGPYNWEVNEREFFRYYRELMVRSEGNGTNA